MKVSGRLVPVAGLRTGSHGTGRSFFRRRQDRDFDRDPVAIWKRQKDLLFRGGSFFQHLGCGFDERLGAAWSWSGVHGFLGS